MVSRFGGRSSYLVLFCLFALAPLLLLVFVPLQLATSSLRAEATRTIETTSSANAASIFRQMNALESVVDTFAMNTRLHESTDLLLDDPAHPVRAGLREIQRSNPNIRTAFLLDRSGRLVSAEPWNKPNVGADYSYRDYYSGAIGSDRTYVSPAFVSVGGRKLVTVSRTVHSPGVADVAGVLVVTVDVQSVFQVMVDELNMSHDVALTIYDQQGNIVARPGSGTEVVHSGDSHALAASQGRSWSGESKTAGKNELVSYDPVGSAGWSVSTAVDSNEAFAPVKRLQSGVLLLACVLALVTCAGLVWLAKSLRARDVAESQVRAGEKRTRQIVETAAQAYYEVDSRGQIVTWNRQAELTFGWTRDEIVGRTLVDTLIAPEHRETVEHSLRRMLDDGPAASARAFVEAAALHKSGEVVMVDINMWSTIADGDKTISAFVQDVSERKRLDQERELIVRRQRHLVEELRQADKAKTDFISTISHELRTPLTSIVGYVEMMHDGFGGDLSEQQTSMLDVVDRNSRRLLRLIDDVLTLSRIETGTLRIHTMPVDISSMVTGAQQALYPQVMERNLVLDVDVATNVGFVSGDPHQLERVLLNLLSNAVKFTPNGGRVTMRANRHDDVVRIEVSDTGIGIPLDEQHRLFSRFFRASSAHEHAVQGTGLGLTIVKSIVDRHGGEISVESVIDQGTTICIDLPATFLEAPVPSF